jgi:hypothetical protein
MCPASDLLMGKEAFEKKYNLDLGTVEEIKENGGKPE